MTAEPLDRDDQKQHADERLETALLEGLDSGEPVEINDEWWRRKRMDLTARLNGKRNQKRKSRRDDIE
jgi:antitoxin ParD1/3/4